MSVKLQAPGPDRLPGGELGVAEGAHAVNLVWGRVALLISHDEKDVRLSHGSDAIDKAVARRGTLVLMMRAGAGLETRLNRDPPGGRSMSERLVIPLVLIGVSALLAAQRCLSPLLPDRLEEKCSDTLH